MGPRPRRRPVPPATCSSASGILPPTAAGPPRTRSCSSNTIRNGSRTGSPGAGDITVFSNGLPKVRGYSTVEQVHPITVNGEYVIGDDGRFAATVTRVFPTREADREFAAIISSAQRLPNGNTLLDYGSLGHFVEARPNGSIVWDYENPRYTVRKATPTRTGRGLRHRAVVDLPGAPVRARLPGPRRARNVILRPGGRAAGPGRRR